MSIELVKEVREKTGAGILDCRKALQQANGDVDRALQILREQGLATAQKHLSSEANEGLIEAYIHTGSRIGALVELNCETDFVSRTPAFGQLAHDLAMQVVGYRPRFISREDVPEEALERERGAYRTQAEQDLTKFYEEVCLLEQPFIRNSDEKVGDVIAQMIATVGENIVVRRFARFELGEE